ncbi:type IV secretory system conjugative DNA transfer family protein [Edwardsiella tarda]|uniref:type IV secretory system conjugative DNA transfer family protein n=1 Tax=Edwardsiella tarda TaxID=636 RepID=UPI003A69DFEA
MDEFTAMGQSEIIGKSNNYFAGYVFQLPTIVQNPAQISFREPAIARKQKVAIRKALILWLS